MNVALFTLIGSSSPHTFLAARHWCAKCLSSSEQERKKGSAPTNNPWTPGYHGVTEETWLSFILWTPLQNSSATITDRDRGLGERFQVCLGGQSAQKTTLGYTERVSTRNSRASASGSSKTSRFLEGRVRDRKKEICGDAAQCIRIYLEELTGGSPVDNVERW